MDTLVKDYIKISISLILFVVMMSGISYAGTIGYDLLGTSQDKRSFKKELQAQRELSQLDDTIVTHDDILIAVKKYNKQYRVLVQPFESYADLNIELTVDTSDYYLTELDPDLSWGTEEVDKKLTALESYASIESIRYRAVLERDSNTGLVTTLVFTKQ